MISGFLRLNTDFAVSYKLICVSIALSTLYLIIFTKRNISLIHWLNFSYFRSLTAGSTYDEQEGVVWRSRVFLQIHLKKWMFGEDLFNHFIHLFYYRRAVHFRPIHSIKISPSMVLIWAYGRNQQLNWIYSNRSCEFYRIAKLTKALDKSNMSSLAYIASRFWQTDSSSTWGLYFWI